ncbi:MAG: BTAD domain-containing putative transcriptional regulator [Caldilineaceae bacterium]
MLHIRLFGTPQLRVHERSLTAIITGRELALLVYLAVTGKVQDRSTLVDLLWQEVTEAQARKNLRNILYSLRQNIGDYLDITRQTISLQISAACWLDVAVFSKYWNMPQTSDTREMLSNILALYQGDFLEGFAIQDAPVFDAWLLAQRRTLQEQAIQGLLTLAQQAFADNDYNAGLVATRRLLAMAPWHEGAHLQQMLLLAHSGQRDAALSQYTLCQQALAEEYGVAPLPETTALYIQIKNGQLRQLLERQVVLTAIPSVDTIRQPALPAVQTGVAIPAPNGDVANLPQVDWDAIPVSPRLVGRETELNQLEQWLLTERCRVVALFGIGGQGKTVVAADLVHRLVEKAELAPPQTPSAPFFTRILWVSASRETTVTHLLHRWLAQLGAASLTGAAVEPFDLPAPPLDYLLARLIHHLRTQRCLLILDQTEGLWHNPATNEAQQEAFTLLLRWLAESEHQSCFFFLSREQPQALIRLARQSSTIRTLHLARISSTAGVALLRQRGLTYPPSDLAALVTKYGGNPLALTLLTEIVHDFPVHTLQTILKHETLLFSDLQTVLKQQFQQLPALARTILIWLALEQAPIPFDLLWEQFLEINHASAVMEAYRVLQQAFLLEQTLDQQLIRLPALFQTYITQYLIEQIVQEINIQEQFFSPITLNTYLLFNPQRSIDVQMAQKELILQPILHQLASGWGEVGLARRLTDLLATLTTYPFPAGRYAKRNLQTLLTHLKAQYQYKVENEYVLARQLA